MKATMRVKIESSIYNKMIQCIEKNDKWLLDGKCYDITGAKRIEHTDYVRIELTEVTIK